MHKLRKAISVQKLASNFVERMALGTGLSKSDLGGNQQSPHGGGSHIAAHKVGRTQRVGLFANQ